MRWTQEKYKRFKIGKYERRKLVDIQGFASTKYISEFLD
jgi:hypothetical protein